MGKKKRKKKDKNRQFSGGSSTDSVETSSVTNTITEAAEQPAREDATDQTASDSTPFTGASDVSRETAEGSALILAPDSQDHVDDTAAVPGSADIDDAVIEPSATAWPQAAEPTPSEARRAAVPVASDGTNDTGEPDRAPRRAVSRETLPRPVAAPRVLVVANQKGGVGKTTTAVNVAAALALGGLRVLLIDLDPQGNASTALGVDHGPEVPGTYEALIEGQDIADLVRPSPESETLQVLPASVHLAGAEIQLVGMVAREGKLAKAIRRYVRDHDVDYVFLDCPPSLGLLTVNALVAADEIMIPIQCEYYALEGVSQLMNTIEIVKGELNDGLQLSTVLLTMFDARTRLAAQVADEVRTHFAAETLASVIPRSVRISEAPSYGRTVMTYDPESTGARSYHAAAAEIARRGAHR